LVNRKFEAIYDTKNRKLFFTLLAVLLATLGYLFFGTAMTWMGKFLVLDEEPVRSDAVVVLNTGVQLCPRLMEAAALYREGFAGKVVINGDRTTDLLRELEKKGFQRCFGRKMGR
jgi:uncharacterized SAM-binding protein YcdF (DUF218 family)